MKAYITNASLKMIFRSVKPFIKKDSRENLIFSLKEDIESDNFKISYSDIDEILATSSLNNLKLFKLIIQNLEEFNLNKNHILTFIEEQNKKYKYQVKAPAYHLKNNCEWMKKSFKNIIKDTGEEIYYENSGNIEIENNSLENLIFKTEKSLKQLKLYFNTEFAKKIKNYRYAPKITEELLKNEKEEVKNEILEFHKVKKEFIQLIFSILQQKYNTDLSFDKTILDFIGFRNCSVCG